MFISRFGLKYNHSSFETNALGHYRFVTVVSNNGNLPDSRFDIDIVRINIKIEVFGASAHD